MTVNDALGILHRNVRHRLSVAVEERTTLRPDGTTDTLYGIDTGFNRYFGPTLERCLHSAGLPTAPLTREYDDAARWPERGIPVKVMSLPGESKGGDDVDLITETVCQPACADGCRQKAG